MSRIAYDEDGEPMTWHDGMGRWERDDELEAEFRAAAWDERVEEELAHEEEEEICGERDFFS